MIYLRFDLFEDLCHDFRVLNTIEMMIGYKYFDWWSLFEVRKMNLLSEFCVFHLMLRCLNAILVVEFVFRNILLDNKDCFVIGAMDCLD